MNTPRRLAGNDPCLQDVLNLIRRSFAYMDGRIDPPSSMHRLTVETLQEQCRTAEIWVIGAPPQACVFLTPMDGCLHIGKLAVDRPQRRMGLARRLVRLAAERAAALGLPVLQLQTRVELAENHAAFARMGFVKTAETAHEGFDRPTSITMRKPVRPQEALPGPEAPQTGRQ
ncbi:GNAT family N-acetyltransferase [Leisingera sp. D0M16]|uniref:GNAT family N-acetyltransferase n=1 Tax=Leisingera coralii TaxID=3351347 RepID=UPI003B80F8D3